MTPLESQTAQLEKRRRRIKALFLVAGLIVGLSLQPLARWLLSWCYNRFPEFFQKASAVDVIVYIGIGLVSLLINLAFVLSSLLCRFYWKCPVCDKSFGTHFSFKYCASCGTRFNVRGN